MITGTGWRRGGGPATWARWSMARASASTLDGARARKVCGSSRSRRLPATTSRAQWGCIGACQRRRRRAVSDRTAAGEQAAQEPRGAPGDWHPKHCEPVPGVLLPCSLTVRRLCPGTPGGFGAPSLRGGRGCVLVRHGSSLAGSSGGNPTHGNGNGEVGLLLRRRQGRGRGGDEGPARRQGRQPRRDDQSRPAGAARASPSPPRSAPTTTSTAAATRRSSRPQVDDGARRRSSELAGKQLRRCRRTRCSSRCAPAPAPRCPA